MTPAQRVAAHYRKLAAMQDIVSTMHRDEFNAIADVVEAAESMHADGWDGKAPSLSNMDAYDTAIAKLAKAVGVEGGE